MLDLRARWWDGGLTTDNVTTERPAAVAVARVDEAVRRGCGFGVRELTERLHGPLRDRPAERAAAAVQRVELWAEFDGHPLVTALPALRGWVAGMRRGGLIGESVTTTREHCRAALTVLAELHAGGAPLPVLAQRALADPHALDEGTRLSNTVLRALAALHDEPPPVDAAGRRDLWALHGVTGDELSTTVLVTGFAPPSSGALATTLRAASSVATCRRFRHWPGRQGQAPRPTKSPRRCTTIGSRHRCSRRRLRTRSACAGTT